jgi:hypothetical protein
MRCECGIARAIAMRKHPRASEATGAQLMGTGAHLWHCTAVILATAVLVGFAGWSAIALWFQAPGGPLVRALFITAWLSFALAALLALHRGHAIAALVAFALAMCALLLWWHSLKPSNDRIWADDVARIAAGEVHGDLVTLSNVRNFDWRSETDYTQRWETRSFDLRRLQSLDMITSYWTGPAIAHVLLSFGFADGQHVVFSVEVRRQKSQQFSEIGGFFKEFELSVIAADERDVIRVRTNIRGEDDYLYRIRLPLQDIRLLFLSYVNQSNELVHTPRFYNTVTVNCTTLIYHMMERIVGRLPFSYRLLLSGYLPGYVYAVGGLDQRYTLEQLRAFGRITQRAQASDRSASFSRDIRRGIPALESAPAGT